MTLFELTFSLSALILGLALTHMASNLYKLAHEGRRVRWAPEPLLQTALVLLIVVYVWVDQWEARAATTVSYGQMLLQVLKLLALYVAAAACLPDRREGDGEIDLHRHYDSTRRLSFGALITGLVLFSLYAWTSERDFHWRWGMLSPLIYIGPYVVMMFVRRRWLNILLLAAALVYFGSTIFGYELHE